jgi:hypothetical protein
MIKHHAATCQMCEEHPASWTANLSYAITVATETGYEPGRIEETLAVCERCKREMDVAGDLVSAIAFPDAA